MFVRAGLETWIVMTVFVSASVREQARVQARQTQTTPGPCGDSICVQTKPIHVFLLAYKHSTQMRAVDSRVNDIMIGSTNRQHNISLVVRGLLSLFSAMFRQCSMRLICTERQTPLTRVGFLRTRFTNNSPTICSLFDRPTFTLLL